MGKMTYFVAAAALATSLGGAPAAALQSNPVDRVSNPAARDYDNIEVGAPEMGARFVRDGMVAQPQLFAAIRTGLPQGDVQTMLGDPLRARKRTWDYNFQLKLPQSQNYLVCQYKILFDKQKLVQETIWRRRQCQQLADGAAL
jgi:outer membrane protein assembly factor BamE (lipoprotein component of BamABCDE complex)